MKISIIGSGRVGLCLGAVITEAGFSVLMTDKNPEKKHAFNGKLPFFEPELEKYISNNKKRLIWTRQVDKIVASDLIFFCLSSPVKKTGDLDLTELYEWIKLIPEDLNTKKLVIIKSTCSLGTHQKIEEILKAKNIALIMCPEFLREGQAIQDLSKPERLVIGTKDLEAAQQLEEFYTNFSKAQQVIVTDPQTAELAKLACNSYLAIKISFINEWASLCETLDGDIKKLQLILGSDSRIGKSFLTPGLGYGGYCLPKDVQLAIWEAKKRKQSMNLLKSTQQINQELTSIFLKKIKTQYKNLKNLSLAFWGISFKKNTDNIKNSPALDLLCELLKKGVLAHVYDPFFAKNDAFKFFKIHKNTERENKQLNYLKKKILQGKVFFYPSALKAIENRQGLIVGVDSQEYKMISLKEIKTKLACPFLVDGRSIYSKTDLKKQGFSFYQRGSV